MKIMQEEIFGPLLPVVEYDEIDEATKLINSKDRPLGLYYFGNDQSEQDNILNKTSSGGVTVNNVISHLQQNDLSFGGVGPSGMGRYKSFEGFKNFSNPRAYYKDVSFKLDKVFDAVRPPYKENIEKRTKQMIADGLLDEINSISYPSKTVLQAIGLNLSEDIEENINIKTKRLGKKQITWFKKEDRLKMINSENPDDVYKDIMEIINE